MPEGPGVLKSILENYTFEGNWSNDQKEGPGTIRYSNGDVFEGDFKSDEKVGQGKLRFANNDMFEGEFFNGKRHGFGTLKAMSLLANGRTMPCMARDCFDCPMERVSTVPGSEV